MGVEAKQMAITSDGESKDDVHHVRVNSVTAQSILREVFESLPVGPEDVEKFEVEIKTGDVGDTELSFETDGPDSGLLARSMLNGVVWDSHPPVYADITIVEKDSPASSTTSPRSDPDPPGEDDGMLENRFLRSTDTDTNGAEDGDSSEGDSETYEAPSGGVLNKGTNQHIALTALACYYSRVDKTKTNSAMDFSDGGGDGESDGSRVVGVTVSQIKKVVDVPLDKEQLTKALYDLRKDDFVNEVGRGSNGQYRVIMTNEGWQALVTLGRSKQVESFELDTTNTDSAVEALRNRDFSPDYEDSDIDTGQKFREEPDVDSPKPIKKGTRLHEVLTMLYDVHSSYGEDRRVSVHELYNSYDHDFPTKTAMSTALSDLFLKRAQCKRIKDENEKGNTAMKYRINESGIAEINRLGKVTDVLA